MDFSEKGGNMTRLTALTILFIVIAMITASGTEIDGGFVSGDWYSSGNPYNINGEIVIHADSALTIHEGVEVIFQGHYKFIVNGILEANGVEEDSILFTAADTTTGWHSLRLINAQDTSHLSYCIVEYGIAVGSTLVDSCGGGISCDSSNVSISDCRFTNNTAYLAGGGIYAQYSNITVTGCEINYNSIFNEQLFGAYGGGLCFYVSDVVMTQCSVMNNHAPNTMGGGVSIVPGCNAIITDCEMAFNTSCQGGGLNIQDSDATVTGCDIHDNTAVNTTSGAGGICVTSFTDGTNISISNCTVTANLTDYVAGGIWFASYQTGQIIGTMQNCVVADNYTEWRTGGIYNQYCDQLTIDQCTVSGNSSVDFGAEITVNDASSTISNTIVKGSSSNESIRFFNAANATISYCDVYNSVGPTFGGDVPDGLGDLIDTNINGDSCDVYKNICMDPLFYAMDGDSAYYLAENSPCIDAGSPDSPLDPDGTIADIGAFYFDQSVGIDDGYNQLPGEFSLSQNYPNPFNASTTIKYQLPKSSRVTIEIYDILGRRIEVLHDGIQPAGYYRVIWNAGSISSGLYFCKLQAGEHAETKKMVLIK
jgi:parallel beta-helix repeat protein